jgi:hypothetical protein
MPGGWDDGRFLNGGMAPIWFDDGCLSAFPCCLLPQRDGRHFPHAVDAPPMASSLGAAVRGLPANGRTTAGAMWCKAPRQGWHLRRSWQRGHRRQSRSNRARSRSSRRAESGFRPTPCEGERQRATRRSPCGRPATNRSRSPGRMGSQAVRRCPFVHCDRWTRFPAIPSQRPRAGWNASAAIRRGKIAQEQFRPRRVLHGPSFFVLTPLYERPAAGSTTRTGSFGRQALAEQSEEVAFERPFRSTVATP